MDENWKKKGRRPDPDYRSLEEAGRGVRKQSRPRRTETYISRVSNGMKRSRSGRETERHTAVGAGMSPEFGSFLRWRHIYISWLHLTLLSLLRHLGHGRILGLSEQGMTGLSAT